MKNKIEIKTYYTARELADMLSYNIMTIYRYIGRGKLKAIKFSKEFRIEKTDWDKFVKQMGKENDIGKSYLKK
jgi:excisionase family DNA binding protein